MKRIKIFCVFLCSVVLFVNLPLYSAADEVIAEFVPGEIIISTENPIFDTSSGFVTMSSEPSTLVDFEENEILSIDELEIKNEDLAEITYVAEIDGDVLKTCEELEKLDGVAYAEPNYIYHTTEFTMPGEITRPSPLYQSNMQWYLEDIMSIPSAWEEYETTGENVVIAIIDNGFDITAGEFPENLWTDSNGNHGWNTYKNSADISPIYKNDGTMFENTEHGTHVAGVIGMAANGYNGIGAAYNADLMLLNAAQYISETSNPGFATTDIVEAIDYARVNGADVINLSLGGYGGSTALKNAINNAYNAGVAVIAAAGNDAKKSDNAISYPAGYENAIGVMAIDKSNPTQLAYFSNYNGSDPEKQVYDVAAPGVSIVGCCLEEGKLITMSGTSQASPLVAACAALYKSVYPNATNAELYEAIRNSPQFTVTHNTTTETANKYEYKKLNALELLAYGKVTPEIIFNLNTTVTSEPDTNYIYGLVEGYEKISDYVTVTSGTGTAEIISTENGGGTGTKFNVYDIYGELYKSYTIIIFGDVNGDSYADGQDAVIISAISNNLGTYSEPIKYAADVDFDGNINENDYYITADYAINMDIVFQTK